jgi:hypothetical protein
MCLFGVRGSPKPYCSNKHEQFTPLWSVNFRVLFSNNILKFWRFRTLRIRAIALLIIFIWTVIIKIEKICFNNGAYSIVNPANSLIQKILIQIFFISQIYKNYIKKLWYSKSITTKNLPARQKNKGIDISKQWSKSHCYKWMASLRYGVWLKNIFKIFSIFLITVQTKNSFFY